MLVSLSQRSTRKRLTNVNENYLTWICHQNAPFINMIFSETGMENLKVANK